MNAHIHGRAGFGPVITPPPSFLSQPPLERAAGVPRGGGILAALGAALGGGVTGVILGICAGPIGIRIGGGVGATVALLAFYALHARRRQRVDGDSPAAPRPVRRHWLVRGLASAIGCLLLMMGACAGVLTYLLFNDDRVSGMTPAWTMVACVALLACSYPFLSPSRPIPQTPSGMRVQPIRAQRWR